MVPESDNDDALTVEVKGSVYALATRPESEADPKVKVKGGAYVLAAHPESGSDCALHLLLFQLVNSSQSLCINGVHRRCT